MTAALALDVSIRDLAFDHAAVTDAIDASERDNLAEIGDMLVAESRAMLKSRSRSSRPGESPTSWGSGRNSLRNMAWDYSGSSHDVVAGPVLISSDANDDLGNTTLPELLEFGGLVKRGNRSIRIAERSYTGKALSRLNRKRKLRDVFHDSVGPR